jgi:ACR3 family arsenite transporter
MKKNKTAGIGFFEKISDCLGHPVHGSRRADRQIPAGYIPAFLGRFEYANVSIPIAVLIWLMIYPMMLKLISRA